VGPGEAKRRWVYNILDLLRDLDHHSRLDRN
jgi:hypothetical protein